MENNETMNNSASFASSPADDEHIGKPIYYTRLSCYVIIFIVGVIGNTLVCLVVCRQRKMKNVTNYFIFNLAVSDLSVLLICIPFDFGEIVTETFPYGAFMCRLIYPLQTLATTASVGTLVAISLNRWVLFAVSFSFHNQTCMVFIGLLATGLLNTVPCSRAQWYSSWTRNQKVFGSIRILFGVLGFFSSELPVSLT